MERPEASRSHHTSGHVARHVLLAAAWLVAWSRHQSASHTYLAARAGWVEALEEILHNSRAPQILRQPDGTYNFAVQVRRQLPRRWVRVRMRVDARVLDSVSPAGARWVSA